MFTSMIHIFLKNDLNFNFLSVYNFQKNNYLLGKIHQKKTKLSKKNP